MTFAVINASSMCAIECYFHPVETESHNQHEHEHNEKAKSDSSHSHQDNENTICCETLVAYISKIKCLDNSLPVLSGKSLVSRVEISILLDISSVRPYADVMANFSSRQWERYALSNPPNGPPVI